MFLGPRRSLPLYSTYQLKWEPTGYHTSSETFSDLLNLSYSDLQQFQYAHGFERRIFAFELLGDNRHKFLRISLALGDGDVFALVELGATS